MSEEAPVLLPRLLLPSIGQDLYNIQNEHLNKKRCVGSSHGWLITVGDDSSITAVNPLIKDSTVIQLPTLVTFPDILDFDGHEYLYWTPFLGSVNVDSVDIKNTYIKKVFLSKDPTEAGCMAIAIFGELKRLAFCRVGDKEWNILDEQEHIHGYEDVVFDQEGRFCAVNSHGFVIKGDLIESPIIDTVYEPSSPNYADRKYLVFDPKGKLMLINRYVGNWKDYDEDEEIDESCYDFPHKTSRFEIFGLDEESGEVERVYSLEDGVLFLGDNQSLCLSSKEFSGCLRDRVYFTDDSLFAHIEPRIGGHDIGVYNMRDGSIDTIQCIEDEGEGIWPPPIWVTLPPISAVGTI